MFVLGIYLIYHHYERIINALLTFFCAYVLLFFCDDNNNTISNLSIFFEYISSLNIIYVRVYIIVHIQ